jgi:hypothetical protein
MLVTQKCLRPCGTREGVEVKVEVAAAAVAQYIMWNLLGWEEGEDSL